MKTFFRIGNMYTQDGLWYNQDGEYTGLIHKDYEYCRSSKLPMKFDKDIVGYLSATETFSDLLNWFPISDIHQLEMKDFRVCIYQSDDYKQHNGHWLISKDSKLVGKYLLSELYEEILRPYAEIYRVDVADIRSKNRERKLADIRKIISYNLRERDGVQFKRIANILNCHHSTVMYSVSVFEEYCKFVPEFKRLAERSDVLYNIEEDELV